MLQSAVPAPQVLLPERVSVLQLGKRLVLDPVQDLQQLLLLLVLADLQVHRRYDILDQSQCSGQICMLLFAF